MRNRELAENAIRLNRVADYWAEKIRHSPARHAAIEQCNYFLAELCAKDDANALAPMIVSRLSGIVVGRYTLTTNALYPCFN